MPKRRGKSVIGELFVQTKGGIDLKLVFVKNRSKKRDFLVLLSTVTSLPTEEIVRIYGMRWDIETFFKAAKHTLKLGKEFESRSFDAIICHTSIVYTRFIVPLYILRRNNDFRTYGGIFEFCCEEVKDMDYETAITSLLQLFLDAVKNGYSCISAIKSQLLYWFNSQACYIKALVGNLHWES